MDAETDAVSLFGGSAASGVMGGSRALRPLRALGDAGAASSSPAAVSAAFASPGGDGQAKKKVTVDDPFLTGSGFEKAMALKQGKPPAKCERKSCGLKYLNDDRWGHMAIEWKRDSKTGVWKEV